METGSIIGIAIAAFIITALLSYYIIKWRFEKRFRQWLETEALKLEQEKHRIRQAAINQSRAVLGGKFTEQMAPYLPEFKYDPTEARFIGSPIDLVVFPGLATGDPQEVVIMEIKTGQECRLTPQQNKIRQLIEDGMVRWELIEHNEPQVEE
ncbi:MAG: Holliday junction resolvase-like protein [Chloroflexota bacterium]